MVVFHLEAGKVHFCLMPAFTTARRRRKRRSVTIRQVATYFGVHERTLRRWIARPELRQVLRAYRHGKQWRLDIPTTDLAFARYKRDVLRAVRPFRRKRHKRISRLTREVARTVGFVEEHREVRERALRILHEATRLKLANARITSVFKAKSKLAERTHNDRSAEYIGTARIIAASYGCDVFDVPKYLDRWIAEEPTRERKNLARRMRQDWPTHEQWDKASVQVESQWRERTLRQAADELAKENERISGKSLAPLLFLNWRREIEWKLKEKLKLIPDSFLPPGLYDYGRRGIKLRLFRQRYKRGHTAKAREIAEGMAKDREEKDRKEKDAAGYGSDVTIRFHHSEDSNQNKDALHVEDGTKGRIDASVIRAIRDCKKAIRETASETERRTLTKYLRELKSDG
jgi:excisionase family DNA binding protein